MDQKPTIGRIVHYKVDDGGIAPAIITRVHNDDCVNLRIFLDGRPCESRTSVVRGDGRGQWDWPPIK